MKPATREWVKKAENDFKVASQISRHRKDIVPDAVCFFCQQCIEKYLKARLTEAGIEFPRTHDLRLLLDLCLRVEPLWSNYADILDEMSDYAVDYRYPGRSATLQEARSALKHCSQLRAKIRKSLGLST
ncbi:MAG: HEPN domain-containing protein [Verrucomicrobiae bacterium]|nr:HEPN domain-containing protein [Verrucomicrobiae bacterium]MCX7722193.1 HEPN domain-containing protein [Verrucomicrobiae bacterium]